MTGLSVLASASNHKNRIRREPGFRLFASVPHPELGERIVSIPGIDLDT